ncbi:MULTISPECIES: signal peptide peptidase SppA [unclassified Devosia]|uniref:signal peptide peptidase SppA n=1 Tax=unclassified Devosia TaxID=196773 RepID=UPI0015556BA9|nr:MULTISPECIES: signal peptide peptidase SppA [unclassified Devosia]
MTEQPFPEPTRPFDPHGALAAVHFRRSRRWWRIVAALAIVVAILALLGRFTGGDGVVGDHIARVVIDGAISTNRDRLEALEELAEDDSVTAVIVAINSPGGTTAGGEELYEALSRLRQTKPVVAVVQELGASAAYMTAIAADRVLARRLSIVGSIGVLYQHVNAGKLMDIIGVNLDKVASGPLKAEPDFDEPLVGPARESIAALVNDSFEWFVDVVAERRGLPRPEALALADGRIVTGRMAVASKLIDGIGSEREAVEWLVAERGIAENLELVTAWPKPDQGLGWIGAMISGQARAALGLPPAGAIALDGLVSLWQVDPAS